MNRAVMIALIVSLGASVQAQTTQSSSFEAPRTPWGDPDVGGLWNSSTVTPIERPEGQTEEFLSAEEAATTERAVVDRNARANAPSEVRTEPLPVGGNVGGYNSFWLDRGTTVVPTRRTSIIIDPPNGRLPALTPKTARRLASPEAQRILDIQLAVLDPDSYEQLDLNDRCIWYRGIPTFSTAYNNNYHLFQTPDHVVILQEHIHDTRVIPLDGRPHASERIPQLRGDSRGHWEGDTLVVETTNFRQKGFLFIPGRHLKGERTGNQQMRCASSSDSRGLDPTSSTMSSRSTLPIPGPDRGPAHLPGRVVRVRCTSTPATKATTGS